MAKPRDYKKEYATYQGKPDQIKKRSARNQARRQYEKANGDLPSTTDVDHKQRLESGGTNAASNLRPTSQAANRSWRKGATKANPKGYGK
jgi:hypothetical protein